MFWLGWLATLFVAVFSRQVVKAQARKRFPGFHDRYIDFTLIGVAVLSSVITAVRYVSEVKRREENARIVTALRDYSYVATLNPKGTTYLDEGRGFKETTKLSRILDGAIQKDEDADRWNGTCDSESLGKYQRAAEVVPNFPFSYFFLADCLRNRGDRAWRNHAEVGLGHFDMTTQLAAHHPTHDAAREMLVSWLK